MTAVPLVQIPQERQQEELRRALECAEADHLAGRRFRLLTFLCFAWLSLGLALVGLGFHLTDQDRAMAALLAGILIGNGGPAWTLIIAQWRADQR